MPDKQKQITKEEAYGIFLAAFERSGVEMEDTIEGSKTLKKPFRGGYKKLAEALIGDLSLDAESGPFYNYANYLKDRFNDIKALLKTQYKTDFGYSAERFQPLIDFAQGYLGHSSAITLSDEVVYMKRPHRYLNFWRKVTVGKLTRYPEHFLFESDQMRLTFPINFEKEIVKLPPFDSEWISIQTESYSFLVGLSDGVGSLTPPDKLDRFLSIS